MTGIFGLIAADDIHGVRDLLACEPGAAAERDAEGVSALMQAVYRGNAGVIEAVRAASPPRDIFEAAAFGETTKLKGDPSVFSADGFTPLHLAVFGRHPEAVRALLELGADPNVLARNARIAVRPLHTAAAFGGDVAVVRLLLEGGADPDGRTEEGGRFTPLHSAAQAGNADLVSLLLEYGADPAAQMDDGRTPEDMAAGDAVRELLRL